MKKKPIPNQAPKIYVIDNPSVLDIASFCLTQSGLSHSTFTDTADALRAMQLAEFPPKLLITGCLDSDFSGLQLAKKFKEILPTLKIIVITGYPTHRVEAELSKINLEPDVVWPKQDLDYARLAATAATLLSKEKGVNS